GVARRDVGTGMTDAEVDALSAAIDLRSLRGYWDAVIEGTLAVADMLGGEDLNTVVPADRVKRVANEEGGVAKGAEWLTEFWAKGRTRAWVLAQTPFLHAYGHYFEARAVRGGSGHPNLRSSPVRLQGPGPAEYRPGAGRASPPRGYWLNDGTGTGWVPKETAVPFYEKGAVRIRYEEVGSGFPLLVTPGGGLNSRVSNWPTAVFNAMEAFRNDFRCITMDQRNANGGESTGPIPASDPWGAFADDQLGLMDHLGAQKFFYMGYCIGGPFGLKLIERAPERVVAAVLCQPVGHRPENPHGL